MEVPDANYKYGIVVDSGSSGSRVQIYKWPDPKYVKDNSQDSKILQSPPKIIQEENWTKKITPGISTYNEPKKTKRIWPDHFEVLVKFAKDIIPQDKHQDTPIFVLATAGMRLLPKSEQKRILTETCSLLKKNSPFLIRDCEDHVQIIDGEVEGIYGWLGLNYLMGQLNDYQPLSKDLIHESIGFMDMGGASTQIAFVPSSIEDIDKHREDISTVTIRNINGLTQNWDVFVETWLGFGANEARKRYLAQLINVAKVNAQIGNTVNDPCLPKDAELTYKYEKQDYQIKGIGNYEMCIKTIYPLLLKNVPCKDTPCLFNGVHGPRLNFDKDKFIGISEYWYTANDVFNSGGEYNYRAFNKLVKEFCESDWSTILDNSNEGKYSNLDPNKFLKDACFKASWVINVLHEGFELPRLDIELPEDKDNGESPAGEGESSNDKEITKAHVPFKSADSIDGNELSWTLGKMLLYASSEIPANKKGDSQIGVYPSEISHKKFVPGGGKIEGKGYDSDGDDDDDDNNNGILFSLLVFVILLVFLYNFTKHKTGMLKNRKLNNLKKFTFESLSRIPFVSQLIDVQGRYNQMNQNEFDLSLEEGTLGSSQSSPNLTQLRTRSAINLNETRDLDLNDPSYHNDKNGNSILSNLNATNFINKPFVIPKKNGNTYFHSQDNIRESLQRSASNISIQKSRNID